MGRAFAHVIPRALVGSLVLALGAVAPVAASVGNDTVAGATTVAVGDTISEDTTAADLTDPAETALNANCGAPKVEHGVWFTITLAQDGFVAFDTADSDYSAGIMLFAGTPTANSFVDCGPGHIADFLAGGQAYNMLAFGDGLADNTGGNLVFKALNAVPPPDVSLTLDTRGSVDRFGNLRVTGTVTCTSTDGSGAVFEVFGDVTQRIGRILIHGFLDSFLDIPCDGTAHAWEAFATGDNGIFAGGKVATVAIGVGCTDFCNEGFVSGTISVNKGGGGKH
jgi:hypothetical protein